MKNFGNMRRARRIPAVLVLVALAPLRASAAPKTSPWTGWQSTDDPLVQWRSQVEDWGRNMSPVCQVQFRIDGEGAANFRYDVTFQAEGLGSSVTGHRAGTADRVSRDKDYGAEQILGCRQVTGAAITRVVRRGSGLPLAAGRPHPDGGETTEPAQPGSSRFNNTGPPAARDLLHFPGSYRGPDLTAVRMDPRSLQAVRSESARLDQRLLDWRPVQLWAQGKAAAVGQRDWSTLSTMISQVDRRVVRDLATDASRRAEGYAPGSTLQRFWRAMADCYRHEAMR